MNTKQNIAAFRKLPRFYTSIFIGKYMGKNWSDEKYVKTIYKIRTGHSLNLDNPVTYTDKVNWIKLHDRRPIYTLIADKYQVKKYVSDLIGDEYVIPLLGVWDRFDEIDFEKLPNQFVLKVNHDSGGVYICRDKEKMDKVQVKEFMEKHLNQDFYRGGREWCYKNIPRKIICEEYIDNLADSNYKFFCFNGKVKALYVAPYRESTVDYFDADYRHLNIYTMLHSGADIAPRKPESFDKMKEIASILSKGFPHLRVDLYDVNGKIYFGELCVYHEAGFVPFIPDKWNKIFGRWIKLPQESQ